MSQYLWQVGVSLSLQQLSVLCVGPLGKSNEFRYKELKSLVAASLASTVTNVQDAMAVVLRVIKNRDMSTHTLFNMMDISKKVRGLHAATAQAALTAAQARINRSEFIGGLIRFNIKLPAEKESELWQLVDANGDGDISYNEFKV